MTSQRIRLGVDIDGVLSNFTHGVWPYICQATGKQLAYQDPSGWVNWAPFTEDEFLAGFRLAREQEDFWANLRSYADNVAALHSFLYTYGGGYASVVYVTSRPEAIIGPSVIAQTTRWLGKYTLLPAWTAVTVVTNPDYKPAVARALGLTAWVDDHLSTVLDGIRDGQHAYLLDRPWNGESEGRPAMIKDRVVDSLAEFLEKVAK